MMNARTKQLLGQAYDQAVPETWTTLSSEQLGRVHEKFAELIVEECNQYALRNWEHGYLLGQDLKIYFGFGAEE